MGPGAVCLCTFEPSIAVDSVDACWMNGEVENGKTSFSSISPLSNTAKCCITQIVWFAGWGLSSLTLGHQVKLLACSAVMEIGIF